MKSRITELLSIRYPIIEGGMVSIGDPELAAAVSNAGGLGIITAGGKSKGQLVQEIRLAGSLTDKPFGVNIALNARQQVGSYVEAVTQEKVSAVTTSAGSPEAITGQLHAAGIKVIQVVASVRHAKKAESVGVDAVVAEGYEAGGHNGPDETTTMVLVPQIVDAVKIPVIAAGGIGDARGFLAALALGAEGVQIGTRFIATNECIAHQNYKQAIIQADDTSTALIVRRPGRFFRVLKGPWPQKVLELENAGASTEQLLPYIAGELNRKAAIDGDIEAGYLYCGQVAGMLKEVVPAKEVIDSIVKGVSVLRKRLMEVDL
ncbi:MAG: DUF561 domain-containing protein [Chloroflexi bacterium]|nr:DUF561 domain-containing protein [Chloroflexota bacterium]